MADETSPVAKSRFSRSETWCAALLSGGAFLGLLFPNKPQIAVWFSAVVTMLTIAVHAAVQTPLAGEKAGWKTPTFWGSIAVVAASVATSISGKEIPGVPEGCTKYAAIVVGMLTTLGYNAVRVGAKKSPGSTPSAPPLGPLSPA